MNTDEKGDNRKELREAGLSRVRKLLDELLCRTEFYGVEYGGFLSEPYECSIFYREKGIEISCRAETSRYVYGEIERPGMVSSMNRKYFDVMLPDGGRPSPDQVRRVYTTDPRLPLGLANAFEEKFLDYIRGNINGVDVEVYKFGSPDLEALPTPTVWLYTFHGLLRLIQTTKHRVELMM